MPDLSGWTEISYYLWIHSIHIKIMVGLVRFQCNFLTAKLVILITSLLKTEYTFVLIQSQKQVCVMLNQSINQSNFYSAYIPGEARLSDPIKAKYMSLFAGDMVWAAFVVRIGDLSFRPLSTIPSPLIEPHFCLTPNRLQLSCWRIRAASWLASDDFPAQSGLLIKQWSGVNLPLHEVLHRGQSCCGTKYTLIVWDMIALYTSGLLHDGFRHFDCSLCLSITTRVMRGGCAEFKRPLFGTSPELADRDELSWTSKPSKDVSQCLSGLCSCYGVRLFTSTYPLNESTVTRKFLLFMTKLSALACSMYCWIHPVDAVHMGRCQDPPENSQCPRTSAGGGGYEYIGILSEVLLSRGQQSSLC